MTTKEFDYRRGQFWDNAQAIQRAYESTTDVSMKYALLANMNALLANFKDLYEASRCQTGMGSFQRLVAGCLDPNWIDSRFHDYYDPFLAMASAWTQQLQGITVSQPSGTNTGSTSQLAAVGCEVGICGPVPPSTPLTTTPSGGAGAGGVVSQPISGGAVTIGQPSYLPGGLSGYTTPGVGSQPSPWTGDLPGLTATALTQSGAQASIPGSTTPVSNSPSILGSFNVQEFVQSPTAKILGIILLIIILMRMGGR